MWQMLLYQRTRWLLYVRLADKPSIDIEPFAIPHYRQTILATLPISTELLSELKIKCSAPGSMEDASVYLSLNICPTILYKNMVIMH